MMTKEEILDAAAEIFRIKGYHATSMSDIAGAVNLQKASLYHHVSSKQEILLELLDQALELLTGQVIDIVQDENLPANKKLRRMIHAYLKALTDHFDLTTVLLMEHRSLKPELHARHVPNRDRFESLWREVVDEGTNTGIFSCENTGLAVRNLLGAMNWAITWYNPKGGLVIEEISDQTATLFLNGLRGK
ncbi:MAG: TetR/AcrR family transcriptional regulator [Anaerolineae bacterium]|jgi:AcrR family transcriptional regulator|nr:TetR/AcrR family transcriptional regulator [Anaerolineae bacterium]MBT3712575.1 TetR/AcrR family transcriptional regulator [Anaerolineae bacterium]MBT4311999.1 TetR/AcrR family transcriptional regulator [Anaerolineae bacterium]MBT4458147.1 TetR/AcrR family transcriptional regulator [Anaerolineae bacterium]MBT4841902.1 TetR/AcrR family transcriptional regulator [Anaerolineae bacterium]